MYDACVLYPAPLRDLLVLLGLCGLYRARWSTDVQKEWKRNLLKNRPDLRPELLTRTCELMDLAIPDAAVTGYWDLDRAAVLFCVHKQRRRLKKPPMEAMQYLDMMSRQGLPQIVEALRPYISII